jgi:molecular chaperone DnaK (HSP70)
MGKAEYIIGIDFGTTNCTMAYAKVGLEQEIVQFAIPQIIGAGNFGDSPALPSFLYFPLKEELEKGVANVTWDSSKKYCVGAFAKERGAEVPGRLIASSKSWLCHSGIDRREKLLPLGEEEENLLKLSPLEACAELLRHMREAWDAKNPKALLKKQQVLVTVPASFDPSARQLIQEAAEIAGFPPVILLEEPQAAFYSWLHDQSETWRSSLKVKDKILVVDIGGGTTDFSLIEVKEQEGNLTLERIAVGSHLLLGGDNIDLALAYFAKNKLEEQGHSIDDWQLQSLIHASRKAKEVLMGSNPPSQVDVTIMGRGSRLIGGALKATLSHQEIIRLIVDGFMPKVAPEEQSTIEKKGGIQQTGLPYAQDARITCQLAKFLSQTGETNKQDLSAFILPTAVLFNGGTMKADALQERLVEVLNSWAKKLGQPSVTVLEKPDYDFAVSKGAVYYGLARTGKAIRIRSGTNRSYFIGVEEALPAVPGLSTPLRAVCVVPFGMEEGTEKELDNQNFALVLGEPATFRFFSRAAPHLENGAQPVMGTSVKNWKTELTELHPIESHMDKGSEDGRTVQVTLESKVTELGVLELWCAAKDGRAWKLEFDLRKTP